MKYHIQPKRDFGNRPFYDNGRFIKTGFVVVGDSEYGRCNVMPGACWFETIPEALHGIWALVCSRGDSATFWNLVR